MKKEELYSFHEAGSALGARYEFQGPGMCNGGMWASLHLPVKYEAEDLCRMLTRAFEAGKNARSVEFCRLMGVKHKDDRW